MALTLTKSDRSAGYSDVEDSQLFSLMKNRDSKLEEAKQAWNEFYKRYSKYIWNRCLKQCRTAPEGDVLAKDIFQITVKKVYENASKFDIEKNNGVKGWLSSVVHNEFYNYFNKYHLKFSNDEIPDIPDSSEDEEEQLINDALYDQVVNIKFEALTKLLSCLTAKEYKVVMIYMNYHQLDKPSSHLPDDVMSALCAELNNIKSAAVRQIKGRAMKKLKKRAEQI
jgi:RNA polymerase sigma factor (sigma-70 family)